MYYTIVLPWKKNSSKKLMKAQNCHDIQIHDDIHVCVCKFLTAAVFTTSFHFY